MLAFLTEWITNIIVFILLAVIIDLLLPNSTMQKYAKMVISLLLIIVIINPIFRIFTTDMNDVLEQFQVNNSASTETDIKNSMEFQKKEIQASQRAYILEQMAVQMKTMAEEELVQRYDVTIDRILLSESKQADQIHSQKDLTQIEVLLKENAEETVEEEAIETVQPVTIDTTKELEADVEQSKINPNEVTAFLAEIWEVEEEKITLLLEGGEESLDE